VVRKKLMELFRRWEARGHIGGALYVSGLADWARANRDEVALALPKLRPRWPRYALIIEELMRGD
jgi:hypothetical protein